MTAPAAPQSIQDFAAAHPAITSPTGKDVFGNAVSTAPTASNAPTPYTPPAPASNVPTNSYTGPINSSINNTQQGADLVNANQAQAAKMGITLPGSTYTPSTNTDTTNTSNTTDTTSSEANQKIEDDQKAAAAQADADLQATGKQVTDTINNIQNGTTPLTAGEQAQIDGLKAQFQVLINQQQLQNTGAQGVANVRGYQTGAAEYDPTFQVKTIGAIVSAGQQKIADLNIKMASAVAQMTQSFHDNDIKAVTEAWDIYQKTATAHADYLQKTITQAQDAIKSAQDQAQATQAEADKQQQYQLDLKKFQQTGDQNAFDNALRAEQQKFTEQNTAATQAQNAANAAETRRHNLATESVAAFNAGMGAGGGSNVRVSQSSQLGPSGNPDPVSQKAVLDQITQQYGPMTATAIQGLADYSMNPSDWSTRAGKGGMTREQAVTLAKMYDPTYNDAQYSIRAAYMKSIASTQTGTVGAAVNSANKAVNHLTSFVTTMNKLTSGPGTLPGGAGQTQLGNTITNFVTSPFNPGRQQDLSSAQTEGLGVADEMAKFFKGTGSTDVGSIDSWKSQINTNSTPAQVKGMTQGALTLLAGQLETLSEQYQSTMGKAPTSDFLNQSARASLSSLKNQGYDVPIPGINYTDKGAWQKNGGTQEQWNSSVDALTKAGLPLTDENILQYAQEQ